MRLSDGMKVSLVAGICVLAMAVISKYVINAKLDFVSQYGPVWIYIVYVSTRKNPEKAGICNRPLFWSLAMILVTAGILIVYGIRGTT